MMLMDNSARTKDDSILTKRPLLNGESKASQYIIIFGLIALHLLVLSLFIFVLPLSGPYILLLPVLSYVSIHYFGGHGAGATLASQFLALGLYANKQQTIGGEYNAGEILVAGTILTIICILLWLFMKSNYNDYKQLSRLRDSAQRERDRFIALINTIDTAVVTTDSGGKITLYNRSTLTLLNTNVPIGGQPFLDVFKPTDSKNQPVDLIKEARLQHREVERMDILLSVGQKEIVSLQTITAPIASNFGSNSGGYVVMLRDITKQKSLEDQRNEFISVTSHELRTPIAVIEGSLSTALLEPMKTGMKAEAIKLINTAHENTEYLGRLVKDLATLARAEGEFLDIEIKPIDPKTIVSGIAQAYQQEATKKGLELLIHPVADLHPILTSETYITEILGNYLSNSVKYSKQGTISVGAESASNNAIRFWVKDSGVGISQADQKKLFTKFFRVEDFQTRENGGTGLGLFIAKKLAERIGGRVWCESELGKGSVFYLEIPPIGALKTDSKKITEAEIEDFANAL